MSINNVEKHPAGYPRFAALMSAHGPFAVFRRFAVLRNRLLLEKQDVLSRLEKDLESIDRNEPRILFLGSQRDDTNAERRNILDKIDKAMTDYDDFIERSHAMYSHAKAKSRAVRSLRNWLDGNACISQEESEYLTHSDDLFCAVRDVEGALDWRDSALQDGLILCLRCIGKRPRNNRSSDPRVFIFSETRFGRLAKGLTISILAILMLVPILICSSLKDFTARILVVIAATVLAIASISIATDARMMEIFVGGATYATVLTVFVSTT